MEASKRTKPEIEIPDEPAPEELVVEDLVKGNGKVAQKGDDVTIEYFGGRRQLIVPTQLLGFAQEGPIDPPSDYDREEAVIFVIDLLAVS